MAHIAAGGLHKMKQAVQGMTEDKKIKDLARDTSDVHAPVTLTTDHGTKVSNTDNWLKAVDDHRTGPSLLEDQIAREKIHRFDHERIPERVVHARGTGAFGHFKVLESAADVTSAGVLTDTSRVTPVFVRFSTVQGSRGSADTVRDVRGFAVKFYTDEGNWDLVGNNIPVFFIQDAVKFPDFVHAVKPEPHNEVPQAQTAHNNFWDFVYLHPEATHMFMWAMSDRAIPRSFRMMQGFGVNTFVLVNKDGLRHFVKFHWMPELGVHSLVWDECLKVGGQDPDFHRKDLMEAIDNKAYPKWKLGIQVIPEEKEHDFEFDILDATKIWPEHLVPIRWIGELELNRNVDEFFPQTEQVAFCTSHIVPGIEFSDDPLLQGRNFSYFDTQISRLGINWEELPVNRPVCPVMNHHRDGQKRHRIMQGTVNYWPNRFEALPPANPNEGGFVSYPSKVSGVKARSVSKKFREHIRQAQLFYNSMSDHEKYHIKKAFAFELDHCDDPIVYNRLVERLTEIDLDLAQSVATMVGAPTPQKEGRPNKGEKTTGLSQPELNKQYAGEPTIKSRRIAILVGDGYDQVALISAKGAIKAAGAIPFIIGTKRQAIFADHEDPGKDKGLIPDHHYDGQRSTLFDATFIPGGSHIKKLGGIGQIRHWITESFGHLKPIGATGEAVNLVAQALSAVPEVDLADASDGKVVESYGVVTSSKLHEPESLAEGIRILKEASDFLGKFFYQVYESRNYEREMDGLVDKVAF
ncbi:Catalase A, putative [Coccidioides posadasii C735 delta SOWgp]|uniref:Catalase n=1 Tax=Coccidioides posadasii (strain C735) TaxID=222929 RepID=C5NZQ6_COCP7|nr:Catalase A, putative [Coccidioides posadasii C735 delta SOWgp]EER29949.1 Catalase A, putative [Coccidioides posadasii C735 delta SOWgp]|eukprot:XP_003072094.1 Catalase A, putative [Coccidioides posadasii C735 delta SOWgp]